MTEFISYVRVSTDRQGKSGLGLEAQRKAVADYIGEGLLVREFEEVETGKLSDRPELLAALEFAKRHKATLVVAKLDRMARNVPLLRSIIDNGANVVFCDFPEIPSGPVGRFMLTQMAAVAELEAGLISERTKAALAARKAKGLPCGFAIPKLAHQAKSAAKTRGQALKAEADQHAKNTLPIISEIQARGISSLSAIARELNSRDIRTARGGVWYPTTVRNILDRSMIYREL